MSVKWYYRQSEVPDSVYQHLVQDRNNENGMWVCERERDFFFFTTSKITHVKYDPVATFFYLTILSNVLDITVNDTSNKRGRVCESTPLALFP